MVEASGPATPRPRRRRRWWRVLLAVVGVYLVAVGCGMNPSVPTDAVLNSIPIPAVEVRRQVPGEHRVLVVLQHGLWRSAWALWRLERALVAHGYEVLNVSYPSTQATIEEHAEALAQTLHSYLRTSPEPKPSVCFVGHSLGGLVVRSYLSRPDAVRAHACVFIGTPQRGAMLAGVRSKMLLFSLIMGDQAALQLVPGHPFYASLRRLDGIAVGTIAGGLGDGDGYSTTIPGDDDGTVAVDEATLPEAVDHVVLRAGHTLLTLDSGMIGQVLEFLRYGRFAK